MVFDGIGKILLLHPVAGEIVGVEIPLLPLKASAVGVDILEVPGVVDFNLKISSDGEHFGWENISIAARQKAVTEESKVSVS